MLLELMLSVQLHTQDPNWDVYLKTLDKDVIEICYNDRQSFYPETCREDIMSCTLDGETIEWCTTDYFSRVEPENKEIHNYCKKGIMNSSPGCYDKISKCFLDLYDLDFCFRTFRE